MKLLVVGDSHGNIENLKHVVGFAKKIKAGAIIHCGDWDTIQSVEVVLQSRIPLYTVLGNADIDERMANRLQQIGKTNFSESFLKINIDGKKIGVVHRFSMNDERLTKCDIIFSGHYHSQFSKDNKFFRPGALIERVEFAVYDTRTNKVEFINDK